MHHTKQLGEEQISKLLIRFSVPAIVGMMVNALYNVVDRIFIGIGVGSDGLAAVTTVFPIMIISMAFSMLIGIGTNTLLSIKLGEQRKDEAEAIMGNGVTLLVLVSFLITVIGLVFIKPLLIAFGAKDELLSHATQYLKIILWGTAFVTVGFGMNNFIRAEGNPKTAMLSMLIGAVLNTILDPIFIFTFGWGIRGAAYATIISQLAVMIWVLYYFLSGSSKLKLHFTNLRLKTKIVTKIIAIGLAPFLMQLTSSAFNALLNTSLYRFGGKIAVAGMGIIMSLYTLIFMPILGISQGAQPIIGYNYGAHKYDRVKKTLKLAVIAATLIATVAYILIKIFPAYFIGLFGKQEQQLFDFCIQAIRIFMFFLPLIGLQIVGANYFQAVGKPVRSMTLSLSRQFLLIILILILPNYYRITGIMYSGAISDVLAAFITVISLWIELLHLDDKHQETLELESA